MGDEQFALFGLGNPGSKYELSRHNVGFIFLDWRASRQALSFSADRHQCLSAEIRAGRMRISLLKPQTFMNRSGRAVASFVNYYAIEPGNILVVHDDIDMAIGRIKLIRGGGSGGHNGIRSITSELATPDFYRLKIGVGRPGSGGTPEQMAVDSYVLAPFLPQQREEVESRFDEISQGLDWFFGGDMARAQTHINSIR